MINYALLLQLSGLSQREAALFHDVRPDTVKSWSAGRNEAPAGAITELRDLIALQEKTAAETISLIANLALIANVARRADLDEIELGYPADDHEAATLGWPCVSAWAAMAARVIAGCGAPVRLAPRGSTLGTAAAADAHNK